MIILYKYQPFESALHEWAQTVLLFKLFIDSNIFNVCSCTMFQTIFLNIVDANVC